MAVRQRQIMATIVEAIYDGTVLRPEGPLTLEPNTRVRLTVEIVPTDGEKAPSFLEVAQTLNLTGPPDWSANLDKYLYGEQADDDV
jgi:hypothetical protein